MDHPIAHPRNAVFIGLMFAVVAIVYFVAEPRRRRRDDDRRPVDRDEPRRLRPGRRLPARLNQPAARDAGPPTSWTRSGTRSSTSPQARHPRLGRAHRAHPDRDPGPRRPVHRLAALAPDRSSGPRRRGKGRVRPAPPPGVHPPAPSFAPIFGAIGTFLVLFGLVFGGRRSCSSASRSWSSRSCTGAPRRCATTTTRAPPTNLAGGRPRSAATRRPHARAVVPTDHRGDRAGRDPLRARASAAGSSAAGVDHAGRQPRRLAPRRSSASTTWPTRPTETGHLEALPDPQRADRDVRPVRDPVRARDHPQQRAHPVGCRERIDRRFAARRVLRALRPGRPAPADPPPRAARPRPASPPADVTVTAQDIQFDTATIAATADKPFTIALRQQRRRDPARHRDRRRRRADRLRGRQRHGRERDGLQRPGPQGRHLQVRVQVAPEHGRGR